MEEIRLTPGQICLAAQEFKPTEPGDLGFVTGEKITIIRESEMMYWYIARNEKGDIGTVPVTYLEPCDADKSTDDTPPPLIPRKPPKSSALLAKLASTSNTVGAASTDVSSGDVDYYEHMRSGNEPPIIPPKAQRGPISQEEKHMLRLMEREKKRRLPKGTLVVATATYHSNTPGDLNFRLHEEMILLEPLKDLCWYKAHKAYSRMKEGIIPLTHVRLVYMSDEEEEDTYQTPKQPGHEKIYEDKNDFLNNSGWFTHGSMVMGKDAHYHCLARKAGLEYERFMSIKKSIYLLQYMNEKTFIGKANVLHEEIAGHFESFGKRRKDIREIDDELCHHTNAGGWKLQIWPVDERVNLDLELAKKIVEYDSLMSPDGGMNESMTFTDTNSFNEFWGWLSPN